MQRNTKSKERPIKPAELGHFRDYQVNGSQLIRYCCIHVEVSTKYTHSLLGTMAD